MLTESQYETAQQLIVDLGWEIDRMSSSGIETHDELCKTFNIETTEEIKEHYESTSKSKGYNCS